MLSDRDTAEYLDDPKNMTVVDFNDLCDIEPACIGIYDLPIGSEPTKGSQFYQETHELLRAQVPEFAGNGEGNDIIPGAYDVFVCDGINARLGFSTLPPCMKPAPVM